MRQLFIILFTLFYSLICKGQRITEFDSLNKNNEQNFAEEVLVLKNGNLVFGVIQRPYLLYGKGQLLLIKADHNGNPFFSKKIELPNLGIGMIGDILQTDDNQFIVVCSIDTTKNQNFVWRSTHIGFLKLDTSFNLISISVSNLPSVDNLSPYNISYIDVNRQSKSRLYGVIGLVKPNERYQMPVSLKFDVNIETREFDYYFDTLRYYKNSFLGFETAGYAQARDVAKRIIFYDSFEVSLNTWLNSPDYGISVKHIADTIYHTLADFNNVLPATPDSILQNATFDRYTAFRGDFRKYKDSLLIWAGTTEYKPVISPVYYTVDTNFKTLNKQAAITIINASRHKLSGNNDDCKKVHSITPVPYCSPLRFTFVDSSSKEFDQSALYGMLRGCTYYAPGFKQGLDFIDENKIYYGRTLCDMWDFTTTFNPPTLLMIAQFDSLLNKKWERRMFCKAREGIVSVNATPDGGCVLFTRRLGGLMDDPNFSFLVNRYEFAVYKFDKDGGYLGMHVLPNEEFNNQIKLYPNPASQTVQLENASMVQEVRCTDIYGITSKLIFNENKQVYVGFLTPGIYFISLFNAQHQLINTIKLVKE